jgi:ribonuclease HII
LHRFMPPDLSFEVPIWKTGLSFVAGLDEAGRGAWAGPVSAAAVILAPETDLTDTLGGVWDSKQMTPRQRTYWAEKIKNHALSWGIGFASSIEIDNVGILPATRLAMARALDYLDPHPQYLLVDAVSLSDIHLPQTAIIKGDQRSLSIAAASILAKTERDKLMCRLAEVYPCYGFERHKGYGTQIHHSALQRLGVLEIHRKSFAPVKNEMLIQTQAR